MNSYEVIQLAKKHVDSTAVMQYSAKLCLADAVRLQYQGKCAEARNRAVKSLAYSVGVLHPDYKAATAWPKE